MRRNSKMVVWVLVLGLSVSVAQAEDLLKPDDANVVSLGSIIYSEHCASCHGANLEGEPNWRQPKADLTMPAPPHDETGHTWHHKDELLFKLTKYGLAKLFKLPNYTSNMPVYERGLLDEEIIAALSFIKSRWPEEVRKRHDDLNAR